VVVEKNVWIPERFFDNHYKNTESLLHQIWSYSWCLKANWSHFSYRFPQSRSHL